MSKYLIKRCLAAMAGGGGLMLAVLAAPTDNLRTEYVNKVNPYDYGQSSATTPKGVQLGPGSGRHYYNSNANLVPNYRSTVGAPIAGEVSNCFLGEPLKPPADWDGTPPEIVEDTGGGAVWVDFAGEVITTEAGPIEVRWPTGGSTKLTVNAVVAASPNKRPVRLYWTHKRPEYSGAALETLQNAGPTVTFGQNYKVHIYPTSRIRLYDRSNYDYYKDDGLGYVSIQGTELCALEGTYGSFLLVYSRLDEVTNERKMLAYEVVEVMEPMQTQLEVKIGEQLRPVSRKFDTDALFPRVTRGLVDEAENGEVYVYQHGNGEQKNFLWAIRDSSQDPWKIEIFWRAKEELDVIWPFEVDIYAASWDYEGAQVYIRDTETEGGGKAKAEPVVYTPSGLGVEAMDYQIPKKHVKVNDGVFYTDWADDETFALLKYTSGETVWFQTVRSVPARNARMLTRLNYDLEGVITNSLNWTDTNLKPPPYLADETLWEGYEKKLYTHAPLANEIRAPFAGRSGFFYPGWIKLDHQPSAEAWPVKNPYSPNLYKYPTGYTATNELNSAIYPVNLGELEVWWSLPSSLNREPKAGSGHVAALNSPMFFPSLAVVYTVCTPEEYNEFYKSWMTDTSRLIEDKVCDELLRLPCETPQIVIASGLGSAGLALDETKDMDDCYGNGLKISRLPSDVDIVANLAGSGNATGITGDFTFETRLLRGASSRWGLEMPLVVISNEVTQLTLGIDHYCNFYVNHARKTSWTAPPADYMEYLPTPSAGISKSDKTMAHFAFVHKAGEGWEFYLNSHLVGRVADTSELTIDPANDEAHIFTNYEIPYGMTTLDWRYVGTVQYMRLWSEARSAKEIDQNRYFAANPSAQLVFQYDFATMPFDNHGEEGVVSGPLLNGRFEDSSGHEAHAHFVCGYADSSSEAYMRLLTVGRIDNLRGPLPGWRLPANATIYRQNDPAQDGYNPNEEHAILIDGVAHALRTDLNVIEKSGAQPFTSLPYVLVEYRDADTGRKKMCGLRVVPENDMYRFHRYLEAGSMIQSPDPLARFQPANLQKFIAGPIYGTTDECFKDRKGWYWAQQAGDDGGSTNYVFELSYPDQPTFDYPENRPTDGRVGWMANYTRRNDDYLDTGIGFKQHGDEAEFPVTRRESDTVGTPLDYTYIVDWPENVPKLYVNDTLHHAKDGLPAVRGQLSAKIVYDQAPYVMADGDAVSARLIDPEVCNSGSLPVLPDEIRDYLDVRTGKYKFTDLPPYFRDRLVWNPMGFYDPTHNDTRELELTGKFVEDATAGFQYAWLNVMDTRGLETLTDPDLVPGGDNADWVKGMESFSTAPKVLTDDVTPFTSIALATTGLGHGYVTLVFNDSTNLEMVPKSENVTMYVIKIEPELYNGKLHVIESENPLDRQLNMKYTSDFGGAPDNWAFEWQYCEPESGKAASVEDDDKWFSLDGACGKDGVPMLDWITVGDAGIFGLSDHYIRCRYRAISPKIQAVVGEDWSEWCKPQLAEGWIKRVLKAVNPFDQRIRDLLTHEVDTSLSMVAQAGAPYQGDIPLNLEALTENGLIAIYETVLNQAKKLSIDADYNATESLALALQMAAGRIAELYTVLGNEAYADAINPTVDLGQKSGVDDSAESSVFPFMNQCENLLDEELALLRGRDLSDDYAESWNARVEPWAYPVYNRLQWNFTADIMGGQVAYVENYGIRDVAGDPLADDPKAADGVIDAYDAAALYPQGHGDAWGHYLSAVKGYYTLLRHPNFGWKPQIEGVLAGQTTITIGYLHEKRFAQAAEYKAKTGEKIVADTYRQQYQSGMADSWLLAEDEKTWEGEDDEPCSRAWGTDEWATRAHLGAYYDWAVVNALLPARNAEEGQIKMLDRESVKELGAIAASARRIQATADHADAGMNPLGLSDSAIPFDISPAGIDAGKTHFEQIFERAEKAVKAAKDVFDRVKGVSNALRDQNAQGDFRHMVEDEEAALNRRLIEIYGYPYADDIGAGKIYPQGYNGPDLYHYYYVETYDLDGSGGINGNYRGVTAGDGAYGRYIDVLVDDYSLITTNIVGTYQAERDESLADNGFFGNIIVGAVSWYQDKLAELGEYIDPWSKYTGICSTNYTLPVAVVDTAGDALDGKIDYEFAVAAWTNAPWYASYYVGPNGFTPKPKDFHGQRRAEGEAQIALNGYAALLAEIDVKAQALFAANKELVKLIDELTALDYSTQMGYVKDAAAKEIENYIAACKKNAETVEKTLNAIKELKDTLSESGVEAFPKIAGMSFDLTSAGRAALLAVKGGLQDLLNGQIADTKKKIAKADDAVDELTKQLNSQFAAWMNNADRQKKIDEINAQTPKVKAALAELEVAFVNANEKRMAYQKVISEGEELQCERERLRIQWAADLSQSRYRNMMWQIMRNDELQRYNEAYELAAKYVFLAAKAYDYETGLLESDSANTAGSEFISSIVKARALGRFAKDGKPLGGGAAGDPGLADILFRMDSNWSVLKGRLGFNNPQNDIDSFSLRKDLFGKTLGTESDEAFADALAGCWVEDLSKCGAFARLCQPFDPMQPEEPGFVIPFRTVIAARQDLFGNSLSGGSTAYSSTYFATKLRAVGVWIEGENAANVLPKRPEVYLVPAGLDYMRVPVKSSTSSSVAVRTWQVVDQVLPVPYALADSDWDAADWSALKDICANELCVTRRHPAIRANVGPVFDESATMTDNARLIGRSVWNDEWYIIIPAASLNANNSEAFSNFKTYVKDIHLKFKTYSFSGN